MPVHLRPSAPTAADALLCGDPARALAIAQAVLTKPRMSNHHRGLWGYYGHTPAGRELTVQATGIGGPSAVVVLGELIELGLRRAIRVGTCSVAEALPPAGSGLIVEEAVAMDGASAALGFRHGERILPDEDLTATLARSSGCPSASIVSGDVHPTEGGLPGDAAVADLQTAATFAICQRSGVAAAALLAVARSSGRRLEDEPLEVALLRLAGAATVALADDVRSSSTSG